MTTPNLMYGKHQTMLTPAQEKLNALIKPNTRIVTRAEFERMNVEEFLELSRQMSTGDAFLEEKYD